MSNVLQSASKQFHSTETALLKVHYDVTLNMDKGKVTALTLLDLSAAFDTVDDNILIKRLSMWYGISGTALSWFSSSWGAMAYRLEGRTLNQENPVSNPTAVASNLWQV